MLELINQLINNELNKQRNKQTNNLSQQTTELEVFWISLCLFHTLAWKYEYFSQYHDEMIKYL